MLPESSTVVKEGVFVDSIVSGLQYETETQTGNTSSLGIFRYKEGETVKFAVGDIVLGESRGKSKVTPVDLVEGAVDEENNTVTNIVRFLLTMDIDGNWSNGIHISTGIRIECEGRNINFEQSTENFEKDVDVVNLFDTLNALRYFTGETDRSLVSLTSAREHLKKNLGDTPTAYSGTMTVMKDKILLGILEASDPVESLLTFEIVDPLTNETLSETVDGSIETEHGSLKLLNDSSKIFKYTPAWNFWGTDFFSFRVFNGAHYSNTALITIHVDWTEGKAPMANTSTIFTDEGTTIIGTLIAIATDNDMLTFEIISAPNNGEVSIIDNATGEYTYTPAIDFHGIDSFTFRAFDGFSYSETTQVTVYVNFVDGHAPIAIDRTLEAYEDSEVAGLLFAVDAENDALSFEIVDDPENGAVEIQDMTAGIFSYMPDPNFYGEDSFTFMVYDDYHYSNTAQVLLTVNRVDGHVPVAENGSLAADEDADTGATLPTGLDADNDELIYEVTSEPANGVVVLTNEKSGEYIYTPDANYYGGDEFTYRVFDGINYSNAARISITVAKTDGQAPIAGDGTLSVNEGTEVDGVLSAADADSDTLTYEIVDGPANGSVVLTNEVTGQYRYTPKPDFYGEDSFTFRAFDGTFHSNTAQIQITVAFVDGHVPYASDAYFWGNGNTVIEGQLIATDLDNDPLTFRIVDAPMCGRVVMGPATGVFTYTRDPGLCGLKASDRFTFRANDGRHDSNTADVNLIY